MGMNNINIFLCVYLMDLFKSYHNFFKKYEDEFFNVSDIFSDNESNSGIKFFILYEIKYYRCNFRPICIIYNNKDPYHEDKILYEFLSEDIPIYTPEYISHYEEETGFINVDNAFVILKINNHLMLLFNAKTIKDFKNMSDLNILNYYIPPIENNILTEETQNEWIDIMKDNPRFTPNKEESKNEPYTVLSNIITPFTSNEINEILNMFK